MLLFHFDLIVNNTFFIEENIEGGGGVAIKEGVLYVSYQGKFYVASCNKSGDGAIKKKQKNWMQSLKSIF